jgi:hypothetical protein
MLTEEESINQQSKEIVKEQSLKKIKDRDDENYRLMKPNTHKDTSEKIIV